jgi:hypothetical protein
MRWRRHVGGYDGDVSPFLGVKRLCAVIAATPIGSAAKPIACGRRFAHVVPTPAKTCLIPHLCAVLRLRTITDRVLDRWLTKRQDSYDSGDSSGNR